VCVCVCVGLVQMFASKHLQRSCVFVSAAARKFDALETELKAAASAQVDSILIGFIELLLGSI